MTLKKIIKEESRKVEKYFIEAPFQKSCKIPERYKDIADAVSSKLEDYCVFDKAEKKLNPMRDAIGGPIPNDMWNGVIETTDGRKIDLEIVQSYEQPLGHLSIVSAGIKYDKVISKEYLDIVREAFTSSGLEKID